MASEIEICNIALSRLGISRSINSLTEQSKEAGACSLHYEPARDAVLSDFPWSFATKRVALADLNSAPSDWQYAYRYPTDCMRVIEIMTPGTRTPTACQRIEYATGSDADGTGKLIYTDEPNAWLKYVGKVIDTNMFDAIFRDALAWRMAGEMAMQLGGNANLGQFAMQMYGQVLMSSASRSMEESQEAQPPIDPFTAARLS
ncbi:MULTISPECIES: hypothetical protein [Pectobacterium]|uniref:hypothetical protein n=1 Tax=Pectobacterium TaxID=122277 RepID=UPI001CD3AED8|nr:MULTISPECIES: hypothetical protein [Pectobacterium]UPY96262.1 hypothetical protein MYB54_06020 [Pectobacterium sp. 21LCBS03]